MRAEIYKVIDVMNMKAIYYKSKEKDFTIQMCYKYGCEQSESNAIKDFWKAYERMSINHNIEKGNY